MASVYILYSLTTDSFYVGSCKKLDSRLIEHQSKEFRGSYTSTIDDWDLFFSIQNLNYSQARKIELHVKRMKSKKYILNLKSYPELAEKLVLKYK